MEPTLRIQVHGKDRWQDLELPIDRLPGMVRVVMDGLHIDVARRDGAVDIHVNPEGREGNIALDVREVATHESQARMRISVSRKPAGYHRDDEGQLV